MRNFSSAVQEREDAREPQEKINIDPKEIPKPSKYSFHDNRFSSEKKVFQNKKMGKKELKMDQKWEHDKFISTDKKALKVNIIKKEKSKENIKVCITKNSPNTSQENLKKSNQKRNNSNNPPKFIETPKLPPKPMEKSQNSLPAQAPSPVLVAPVPLQTPLLAPSPTQVFVPAPIPVPERIEFMPPIEPLQMVPQMMIPQMYPDSNFMYSPYMANSGQILYMTENGLFVPSPVGYYPTYVPNVRSKAIPIVKPTSGE